jgi:HSP20 family protein
MDRLFEESFFLPRSWKAPWTAEMGAIPLDVYEEGDNLMVKASVPGVKPNELNVQIEGDVLTISGETKQEKERKEKAYHLREHRYGRFTRSVTLPCPVMVDKAEAVFEDGMLTLTVPKAAEEARGKKIPIKTKK